MFLKRLEVKGFKSFAEPIHIDFVQGVTAVVGPNGSGKSNISDSVRWVLGEQSARSLRGAKMEDIIFAGSDSRRAVNVAEVTLVLDNEDEHLAVEYSEVNVTRRVYRSGESEYLINRQPCRLKDIVDLFLDSGLGREAYSIIGQGKIEEILSSKAEDRRVIFEEAAGVLKYKTRKIKAEKRLAQTEENLQRVADVLNELNEQVEPLKEQASIAKEFLEKQDQEKRLDIQVITSEIQDLHGRWSVESEKLRSLKSRLETRSKTLEEAETTLREYRERSSKLQVDVTTAQNERLRISEELEKNEGKRGILAERQKNAQHTENQLSRTIQEKEAREKELRSSYERENDVFQTHQKELQAVKKSLEAVEAALFSTKENLANELDDAKSDYIEALNEQASIRNERRYLEEQKMQRERSTRRAENEGKALLEKQQYLNERLREAKQQVQVNKDVYEKTVQTLQETTRQEEATRDRYYKQEAKLYEAYGLLQKITAREDVLAEMEAEFSGFFQGVKEILKERDTSKNGIIGAVAELMKVPKDYETAIEVALGAAAQHVVVEEEHAAREAIQFLKQRRLGRATFLPLSTIKPRHLPDAGEQSLQNEEGFIGVAAELIETDSRYQAIAQNLLGTTVVAKHLQAANHLARKLHHRYRVVTLDGDLVNPGGAMTGGSVKQKQSSLLSRKREREEVQQKKVKMEASVQKLEKAVQQGKAQLQELAQQLERAREEQSSKRGQLEATQSAFTQVEAEASATSQEAKRYGRQEAEYAEERTTLEARLEALTTEEKNANERTAELEEAIEQLNEQLEIEQQSKETLRKEQTELKVKQAEVAQQAEHAQWQVQQRAEALEATSRELMNAKEEYALLHTAGGERTASRESLMEKIEEGRTLKESITQELTQLEEAQIELDRDYEQLEEKTKAEQGEYSYLLDESQRLEVRVNRLDVDLENRLSRLREEYELSYEAASEQYPLEEELDATRTKLKLIKLSIEELGTVNLGAIDEYERVRERHEFLNNQREDLQEARETLYQVIDEMDTEMTKRFSETFVQVRYHFQHVFTALFGGGEADLVLTNEKDSLNTGIDIIARPPGKKRQLLGLLSGGERALTAIALLFAILHVRPVPFCVLDEVEAALDEANVSRFAQYLKDFSERTQFIVITHRKGTMEKADVLYGVTMEESGVSRLVSVRLEETKDLMEQKIGRKTNELL
ncbi:chromosome segregation protein SMC [Shouchella shacheensis]|uniref:chromosome segregation protein SMC n=1 Tax=Shouchella shacheensis TaxID=1649580 RepID=UPI00073FB8C4|nr:chromosome segregation protein SMC [Shouchella shacheensis]